MLVKITLIIALLLTIVIPFAAFYFGKKEKTAKSFKRTLAINILTFFGVLVFSQLIVFSGAVSAAASSDAASTMATGLGYIAAGLSTGLSCVGSGIAVASSASSALGAISEDQSILGKSLIFVGLSEGIALYGLIISFMILGKL